MKDIAANIIDLAKHLCFCAQGQCAHRMNVCRRRMLRANRDWIRLHRNGQSNLEQNRHQKPPAENVCKSTNPSGKQVALGGHHCIMVIRTPTQGHTGVADGAGRQERTGRAHGAREEGPTGGQGSARGAHGARKYGPIGGRRSARGACGAGGEGQQRHQGHLGVQMQEKKGLRSHGGKVAVTASSAA
eukprot:736877-Pelagomonas_calceolata.AAC.1